MTTQLNKTLKRAVSIQGREFVVSISPEGLKLTLKGRRKGFELRWVELVSGDAALTTALNASVGAFAPNSNPQRHPLAVGSIFENGPGASRARLPTDVSIHIECAPFAQRH